jgi:hypothetical protein
VTSSSRGLSRLADSATSQPAQASCIAHGSNNNLPHIMLVFSVTLDLHGMLSEMLCLQQAAGSSCASPNRFEEAARHAWGYFENALSVYARLLFYKTSITGVQVLTLMVRLRKTLYFLLADFVE